MKYYGVSRCVGGGARRALRRDVIAVAIATAVTMAIYYTASTVIIAVLARLGGIL